MARLKKIALGLALLPLLGLASMWLAARLVRAPATLGVHDGKLAACPATPNCVSSQSSDDDHAMPPLSYAESSEQAKTRLIQIIRAQPRTTIITDQAAYLHVEFRSALFGFVDDVEILFDDAAKLIHFRSASRMGNGDMGVNRQRMQTISDAFAANQ